METQNATLLELIILILFLGGFVFLLGTLYQIIALIWINKKVQLSKIIGIILITRILSLIGTILLWKWPFQNIEIMFGPILIPAFIAEFIFSPLMLRLFNYKIFYTKVS